MQSDLHEVKRLKRLLTTQRLNYAERVAVEQQIRELEKPRVEEPATTSLPGVFGVFDRPQPTPDSDSPLPQTNAAPTPESATPKPEEDAKPLVPEQPTQPELLSTEVEALAVRISDIADRIIWLWSYWSRTLSPEVDREAQLWLAKLQELARELPEEKAEAVLGDRRYLLHQQVREVKPDQIPQKIQLEALPPSAPSLDIVGTWTEMWYATHEPRTPRQPQTPPGYVADGLQQFL